MQTNNVILVEMAIKNTLSIVLVLAIALFLRLYKLDQVSPSELLGRELEIAFTNNSHLSLITSLSFNLFGVNTLALRIPGALTGALTVALMYFAGTSLAGLLKLQKSFLIGLLSVVLLAVSPWHIQISRSDFGLSFGLFCYILAALLFYRIDKSKWLILIWILPAAISIHSDAVFFLPTLLMTGIVSFYRSSILSKNKILMVLSALLLALAILPIALESRSLFKLDDDLTYRLIENTKLSEKRSSYSFDTPLAKVLYHPLVENTKLSLSNFVSYFQLHSLFFSWDKDHLLNGKLGLFQPLELILLLFGCVHFLRINRRLFSTFLLFITMVVFYTALFRGSSKSIWLLPALPLVVLISAVGFFEFVNLSSKKTVLAGAVLLLSALIFIRFFNVYYLAEKKATLIDEYSEALLYLRDKMPDEPVVVVDATYGKNLSLYSRFFSYVPYDQMLVYKPFDFCKYGRVFVMPRSLIPKGAKIFYTGKSIDNNIRIGVTRL